MSRIVSVANRLPVTVEPEIHKSSGGLVSAMAPLSESCDMLWVGWPGTVLEAAGDEEALTRRLKDDFACVPVYLSEEDEEAFYYGYSNSVLWPILHYNTTDVRQHQAWWDSYREINRRFADRVLEQIQPGDRVWVHDYHLMLLPALLRDKRPDLRIGFFLHTPFPSHETFRCVPQREALLRGLLGADLVGFHTYGYMRHFRSAAMRLLGVDAEIDYIRQETHLCRMGVYPIGIDAASFEGQLTRQDFIKECLQVRHSHVGKRLILSVERLDYTKGLRRRLEAIDRFLDTWPDKDNVVFLFISIPSRGEVPAYQKLQEDVEALVGRINGKHATIHNTPIEFVHDSVAFTQLCALYASADVMFVTPLIDGMNLVAKEYAACRRDGTGVLVLSEFAGAANELSTAITVNPYDVDGMAAALEEALEMAPAEQQQRMAPMRRHVLEHNAQRWAARFVKELDACEGTPREQMAAEKPLDVELPERVSEATRVALFLDYDGTLRNFESRPEAAAPTDRIHRILRALAGIANLDVHLISGRSRDNMADWFGAHRIALIAEHGAVFRDAGSEVWLPLVEGLDLHWKPHVMKIVREFADSTPGSAVEDKGTAIVWHYRRCDPEYGLWKAQELLPMLCDVASNLPVEVQQGNAIVEVSSIQVNKGQAVRHFTENSPYDMVVCIGDDTTDESMFRIEDERMFSVKVSGGPSGAMRRLPGPERVLDVLEALIAPGAASGRETA